MGTPVSRTVRLAYAAGATGFSSLVAATSFYYAFFLTDVAQVPPVLAANALLIGKLWDTVNDPLTGIAMDRVRGRYPLRLWLLATALPLAISATLVWWFPPGLGDTGRLLWAVGVYLVFDTLYTIAFLGFSALGAEAATNYDGRTRLMAFGAVGVVLGYVLGSGGFRLASHFVSTPSTAYLVTGATMGALAGGGVLIAGLFLKEPPALGPQPPPSMRRVLWTLGQTPVLLLASGMGFARVGLTVVSASLPYFAKYVMGDESLAASLIVFLMVVVAALIPVWRRLAERWSKAKAYAASLVVAAVALASFWFSTAGGPLWLLFASVALAGVGMAGHWVLPWAILPDVVDWDQAQTGERRLGLYYAVYGLTDKLARTIGFTSIGWMLGASGFVANASQGASSVWAIRALFGPVPAVLLLLAVPLLLRFPIDEAAHRKIREQLDALPAAAGVLR